MKQLNPYLRFQGNCRDAMEFYKTCLGGELRLMTIGESPMASKMPASMKDKIMHARLTSDNIVIMAADMARPENYNIGNAVLLCVNGTSRHDIEASYDKLAAGGTITMPLADQFFGTYGELTDKFGMQWIFQADPPKK